MKKQALRFLCVFLIILTVVSFFSLSVTTAVSYTNSKGTATVVCGKYKKKFKAKKYGKNFCRALNAALEKARTKATSKKPATVTISKGYYKLDRTIKIYSNTTLKAKNCYFKYYGNLLRNGYKKKASSASGYKGATGITINGGSWDAAVPYSQAGTANWRIQHSTFRFAHCKNITIKNCTFKNNYNCHDIELGGVNNAKITKCNFYNDKGVNIFKNDGGREAIQLDVNTSEAMPEFKLFDNTPCKNITLSYCNFKNKFRGIGSHHAVLGNTFDNIKVHHNYFKNIGGITVYAVYWTNSKIYSNTMESVGLGVDMRSMTTGSGYNFYNNKKLSYEQCENAVKNSKAYIYDNTISLRKSNNTYVRACGVRVMGEYYAEKDTKTGVNAGTYKIYNINVGINANGTSKPNTIKGNVAAGIQLNYAVDSTIKNNTVNANSSVSETSNGIEIKGCENTSVISNTVKNGNITNARGMYLTSTAAGFGNENITVSGNNISSFLSSGVYLYKTNNSIIEKNTVDKSSSYGVTVRLSEGNVVDNNKITNTNNDSVYVYAQSKNNAFTNNTISTTKNTAVYVLQSESNKFQSNTISDSGEYGFLVRESNGTDILENIVGNTTSYGVRLNYGSDKTKIQKNTFTSPNSECIYLNGTNDATKDDEKSIEVVNNTLDTAEGTAAVSVTKANIAAKIYSNFRSDGKKLFYRFKGEETDSFTKVYDPITVTDLTLQKCEGYNMLSWKNSGEDISYRVYREDENGIKMISDTPETICLDNDLYKNIDASDLEATEPSKIEKLNIFSYSISPYKAFVDVKYIGEPISVDCE